MFKFVRFFRSGLLALSALAALPVVAAAESNVMFWRDIEVPLHDQSTQTALAWDTGTTTQSIVAQAKVILRNTTMGSRTVECRLWDGGSADFADVTLAPGAMTTVSLQMAHRDVTNASRTQLVCYGTGSATTGVSASWAKLTLRYGASVATLQDQ